jgi:hypothetical protein
MPAPLFTLHLVYDAEENDISFSPSLAEIDHKLREMTLSCADVISEVKACEFEMVSCCNMPESNMFEVDRDMPLVNTAARVISEVLATLWQIPVREALNKYRQFLFIFEEVPEFDPKDTDLADNLIYKINETRRRIDTLTANVEQFPMFEVHCHTIQKVFRKRLDEMELDILAQVQASAQESMKHIIKVWKECEAVLTATCADEQQLSELKDYMKIIGAETIDPQTERLKKVTTQLGVLADWN